MARTGAKSKGSRGRKRTAVRRPAKTAKTAAKPATGVSVHVGLNEVNPADYSGWSGPLGACEFDATDMTSLAKSQGMATTTLLTKNATRAATLAAIRKASKQLKAGDLFFLSYAGHGGQVDDASGDEKDKLDETWCLYDGQLIDDELYLELGKFAKGVRILVVSDSCHSGTVTRARLPENPSGPRPRMMPPQIARKVYADHKEFYDRLQKDVAKAARSSGSVDPDAALAQVAVSKRLTKLASKFQAAAILISGCQDNQTSSDGEKNGAFTEQVLKLWNNGGYRGNYVKFHAAVRAALPPTQTPNLFYMGRATVFSQEQPFKV